MKLPGAIYTVGTHKSASIKGSKCALCLPGICKDHLAENWHRFRDVEPEIIRERPTAPGLF